MVYELFLITGIWFWLLVVASFIGIIAAIEKESGWWATITFITTIVFVQLFTNANLLAFIASISPFIWAPLIVGYFIMGSAWAAVKWTLFCVDRAEKHHETKSAFLLQNGIKSSEIPVDYHGKWKEFVENNGRHYSYESSGLQFEPLQVRRYKSTIIMWMTYWPISGFWTLVNDPIRRIFSYIYYSMVATLQKIADKQFEKIEKDIRLAKEYTSNTK